MTYKAFGSDLGGCKAARYFIGINNEPWCVVLRSHISVIRKGSDISTLEHTSCWRRLAAPKPVGPAPMTRTSTSLRAMSAIITIFTKRPPHTVVCLSWLIKGDICPRPRDNPCSRVRKSPSNPLSEYNWLARGQPSNEMKGRWLAHYMRLRKSFRCLVTGFYSIKMTVMWNWGKALMCVWFLVMLWF